MLKKLLNGKKKASFVDAMEEGFFTGFDYARNHPDSSREEAKVLISQTIDFLRTLSDDELQRIVDNANN